MKVIFHLEQPRHSFIQIIEICMQLFLFVILIGHNLISIDFTIIPRKKTLLQNFKGALIDALAKTLAQQPALHRMQGIYSCIKN